jgi:hypothetical protein
VQVREVTIQIDMIEGSITDPFSILNSLISAARAEGGRVLRIRAVLANDPPYTILTRRYGLTTEGSVDNILIPVP